MSDADPHREVAQGLFSCHLRRKLKLRGLHSHPEMTWIGHLESYSHLILNFKCFSHRLCADTQYSVKHFYEYQGSVGQLQRWGCLHPAFPEALGFKPLWKYRTRESSFLSWIEEMAGSFCSFVPREMGRLLLEVLSRNLLYSLYYDVKTSRSTKRLCFYQHLKSFSSTLNRHG